jgi:hypothetical protein
MSGMHNSQFGIKIIISCVLTKVEMDQTGTILMVDFTGNLLFSSWEIILQFMHLKIFIRGMFFIKCKIFLKTLHMIEKMFHIL